MAERSAADDDRHYFAYAPNTGAVFAVGQGTGQPPAELNYVKLMPDYSAEMPLWGMPWKDLNLDPALIDRLRAWQRQFDDHFHYERGWDDADIATAWRIERECLPMHSATPSVPASRSGLIRGPNEYRRYRQGHARPYVPVRMRSSL